MILLFLSGSMTRYVPAGAEFPDFNLRLEPHET